MSFNFAKLNGPAKLPVAAFGVKAFIATTVLLMLASMIAGTAARIITEPAWMSGALFVVAEAIRLLLGVLVLWGIWSVGVRLFRFIWPMLTDSQEVEINFKPEVSGIQSTLDGLNNTLMELERDGSRAATLVADAEMYTTTLVALIKGIVNKAETMRTDMGKLQAAMDAITIGDPLKVAQAAGEVPDEHIKNLMRANIPASNGYWVNTTMLIANQIGTLSQWSERYDKFAANLMIAVSEQKSRAAALSSRLHLSSAARPLLQIQNNLNETQLILQPQRRPELAALPVTNVAGLLE